MVMYKNEKKIPEKKHISKNISKPLNLGGEEVVKRGVKLSYKTTSKPYV